MQNKAFILMGIKHSGKSTQGRMLASHFGCDFIDVDEEIQRMTAKSPREIYASGGAGAFLQAEENACIKIASEQKGRRVVISTGGGICENAPALNALRPLGTFVYLQIDEKSAADRIIRKAIQNPNGTWQNLPAYIAKEEPKTEADVRKIFHGFYEERTKTYAVMADITVYTDNGTKEENAKKVLAALR